MDGQYQLTVETIFPASNTVNLASISLKVDDLNL